MKKPIRIAIDGPSGAGKSTVAKGVAASLGMEYIDTGAMYRAIAYGMKERGITCAPDDHEKLIEFLGEARVDFHEGRVRLNGEDIADRIRTPEISKLASDSSAFGEVRTKLVEEQRAMSRSQSVVMDGRDIGTVVFPDAECKIYLTASAEERANRRYRELAAKAEASGSGAADVPAWEQILADMKSRDYNDSHRAISPLRKADDAVEIDSTHLSAEETMQAVLQCVKEKWID